VKWKVARETHGLQRSVTGEESTVGKSGDMRLVQDNEGTPTPFQQGESLLCLCAMFMR
jgi:hypothetical protein